jgi:hypothetical protein
VHATLYLGTTTGAHYIIYDLSEINKHFLPDSALFLCRKIQKSTSAPKNRCAFAKNKEKTTGP